MADYSAVVYLGVIVTKDDFYETDTVVQDCEEDGCPLEVHPNDPFCSKCGKSRGEKNQQITETTLLPQLVDVEPFSELDDDEDPPDWDDLLNGYEPGIHGLRFHYLSTSSEDRDPSAFLGVQLADIPGESGGWRGDQNPTVMGLETLKGHIAEVSSRLQDLGIDREPQLYILCYCSV